MPLFVYLVDKKTYFHRIIGSICFLCILSFSFYNFYSVVFVHDFETIRRNTGTPSNGQLQLAQFLEKNYDYGKILAVRVDNDPVYVASGLPLEHFVHEANYKFYDQIFHQPWIFSRWVVMYNADDTKDTWARLKEPVSVRWRNDPWFHKYYQLVYVNEKKELYKINEDAVRDLALRNGYNIDKIPSINSEIKTWDERKIQSEIGLISSNN